MGGFALRTHRGSEAVQGMTTMRLMAIPVWLSWLCFAIFHFLWSAIRPDSARALAATSPRTSKIEPRPEKPDMTRPDDSVSKPGSTLGPRRAAGRSTRVEFHPGAAPAGHLIACNQTEMDRAEPPRERESPLYPKYGASLTRRPFRLTRNPRPVGGCEGSSGESLGPSLRCMSLCRFRAVSPSLERTTRKKPTHTHKITFLSRLRCRKKGDHDHLGTGHFRNPT